MEAAHETSPGEVSTHKDRATAFSPLLQNLLKIVNRFKGRFIFLNGSFKVGDDVIHS